MKYRVIIPDQDLQPLSGESPADAIHRAVIGRVVNAVPVERAKTGEDDTSPVLSPGAARTG